MVELVNKEPTASLTNLSAETLEQTIPAETKEVNQAPAITTPEPRTEGIRRSKRIAAARSMTVVAEDPTVSNMGPEKARDLMLLARACATKMDVAENDKNLEDKEGEDSTLDSQLGCSEGESALGVIEERFYEYPVKVVALLELGYLQELEQGVFLRIPTPSQRELHPNLSKLARWLQEGQRKQDTFEKLLDDCYLFALGNDIFCDDTFQQNLQTRATSKKNGEGPQTPPAIDRRTQVTRDAYLAVVETGPDLRYDYPPMLEALVQLGFFSEYDKGIFKCVRDPQLRKKAFSLGALATQALHRGLKDIFFKMLVLQGELFECLKVDTHERYWDKVRENFAQARFSGASWREATVDALSAGSTTALTVSRAATAQMELCDVSDDGLSALLGSLPASYSCDRDLGTHKAPRIDNSDPYNVALSVNGRSLQHIIVDTGCEMVVVGKTAARQARLDQV
jgi:hypothetical protein